MHSPLRAPFFRAACIVGPDRIDPPATARSVVKNEEGSSPRARG